MTRINSDVDPFSLKDQHLMAEYRELPMVISALRRSLRTKSTKEVLKSIPKNFTLNTGHVRFFYDKLLFLEERYDKLVDELIKRKFNLDSTRVLHFDGIPDEFFNSWTATETDNAIVKERIEERISAKPQWYKFYGN